MESEVRREKLEVRSEEKKGEESTVRDEFEFFYVRHCPYPTTACVAAGCAFWKENNCHHSEHPRNKAAGSDNFQRRDVKTPGKQIGFVCVSRNGVQQYRGAVCRAADTPFSAGIVVYRDSTIERVFEILDFKQTFFFFNKTIEALNAVAAPFHRFGKREIDGVMWWGWWPEKVEGRSVAEEEFLYEGVGA